MSLILMQYGLNLFARCKFASNAEPETLGLNQAHNQLRQGAK